MSFELYFATRDPEALAIHDKVMADLTEWRKEVFDLIKSMGFDGYRARDFGAPYRFLVERKEGNNRRGAEIEGYKGGDLVYGEKSAYFEYTFHGRHPLTKERNRVLSQFEKKWQQEDGDSFGGRTAEGIICQRLGVMKENFAGNRIILSSVWKMHDGELCIQVPVDKKGSAWILPEIGGIWTELTTSQMVERFNKHNAWAAAETGGEA